jgi:peptide deformylase
MPVRNILVGERNPTLRSRARNVDALSAHIGTVVNDLCDTARAMECAGLAAPQIGEGIRVCVVKVGGGPLVLVNPEIFWRSKEEDCMEEGCLSLPGITVVVSRAKELRLLYRDREWKPQEVTCTGAVARVVQHEIDHLNGVLIVDYSPPGILGEERAMQSKVRSEGVKA